MKSLVPSLGDLFQQPVDNGSFAPGLPSQHLSKSPSLASIQTPNADQRRDAYQQRKSPVEPTPSPMQHDGVGDGNQSRELAIGFESPSPLNLSPCPHSLPIQPSLPSQQCRKLLLLSRLRQRLPLQMLNQQTPERLGCMTMACIGSYLIEILQVLSQLFW